MPENQEKSIFLTWKTGYIQLKIYHEGRLITSLDDPSQLINGFYHQDEALGSIKLKLTQSRPTILKISVNGIQFFPEKSIRIEGGMNAVAITFWFLCFFGFIGMMLSNAYYDFNFQIKMAQYHLILFGGITIIYGVCAYFIGKGKGWAYFLGTSTFIIITILTIRRFNMFPWDNAMIMEVIARIAIIIFIAFYIKKALSSLLAPRAESEGDLIDN